MKHCITVSITSMFHLQLFYCGKLSFYYDKICTNSHLYLILTFIYNRDKYSINLLLITFIIVIALQ